VSILFAALQPLLTRLAERQEGQGLAEYGLILALVAVVAITASASGSHGAKCG